MTDGPGGASARDRILRRFEAWLDEILAAPEPPDGIAAEVLAELEGEGVADAAGPGGPAGCDLYSLWSAMTALSQEVKLQGRSFGRLSEALEPVRDLGASLEDWKVAQDEALAAARELGERAPSIRAEAEREVRRRAEDRVRREMIELLLDLRDRLARGLALAAEHLDHIPRIPEENGWDQPDEGEASGLAEATEALRQGYVLTLDRMDEALEALGIAPLESEFCPFDPETMTAVDT